jgi:hypothetical protein
MSLLTSPAAAAWSVTLMTWTMVESAKAGPAATKAAMETRPTKTARTIVFKKTISGSSHRGEKRRA